MLRNLKLPISYFVGWLWWRLQLSTTFYPILALSTAEGSTLHGALPRNLMTALHTYPLLKGPR